MHDLYYNVILTDYLLAASRPVSMSVIWLSLPLPHNAPLLALEEASLNTLQPQQT